jgi:nicotinamidase-related amidase
MLNVNSAPLADAAAILFVDHQQGFAEGACTADTKSVDDAAAKLAQASQIYGMPIVASVVALRGEPKLTRRLADVLGDSVPLHARNGTNSLDDPAISRPIENTGGKTVLIAGIVTEIAVERAALGAVDKGYRVQVVLDACNGKSERSERAAILRMTQAGIEMTSVPAVRPNAPFRC